MNKRTRLAIALALLGSGCTTFPAEDAVVREDMIPVPGSPAAKAIVVTTVGSDEDLRIKADFKDALKQSLANQGLLSGKNAANFELAVTIRVWDTPQLSDFSHDRLSTMEAKYVLTDREAGVTAWSETIRTTFNAPRSSGSGSDVEVEAGSARDRELGYPQVGTPMAARDLQRVRIANAGAVRTNIARFIEAFARFMRGR